MHKPLVTKETSGPRNLSSEEWWRTLYLDTYISVFYFAFILIIDLTVLQSIAFIVASLHSRKDSTGVLNHVEGDVFELGDFEKARRQKQVSCVH